MIAELLIDPKIYLLVWQCWRRQITFQILTSFKNSYGLDVFFVVVDQFCTNRFFRHDSESKRNRRKSKCSELKLSWGVWGAQMGLRRQSGGPAGVLGGRAPYKIFFRLQRPLYSLKINSNFINCGSEARQKS